MLKQVGGTMGDKHLNGNTPNMKLGEYRYYPQDNPNLKMVSRNNITRRAFSRIIKKCFSEYMLDPYHENSNDDVELKYYIGSVGIEENFKNNTSMYKPIVINKGYICVKEATASEDGTILYLHAGVVMVFKESYVGVPSN